MDIITLERLQTISPQDLSKPEIFTQVEDFVYEVEAEGIPDTAIEAFTTLTQILDEAQNDALVKKYFPMLCALRLIALIAVTDKEKKDFISKNLLTLVRQEYADVKYWLKHILDFYLDDQTPLQIQNVLLDAVANNFNVIGDNDIRMGQEPVKPYIKNWIYDYNVVTKKLYRGAAEATNYINQSPNVKILTPDQRNLLLKVLRLYDWLRFDALKQKQRVEDVFEESPLQMSSLPKSPDFAVVKTPATKFESAVPPPLKTSPVTSVTAPKAPLSAPKPPPTQVFSTPSPVGTFSAETQKEMTAFEKKLAQVSAAPIKAEPKVGVDLVKQRVESEKIKTVSVDELKRELKTPELPAYKADSKPETAPKPVSKPAPLPPRPSQAPSGTSFVSSRIEEAKSKIPIPPMRSAVPLKPTTPTRTIAGEDNLTDIKKLDDLKKLNLEHLRRGPLEQQTEQLKSKIISIARANRIIPFYALTAFEESPLFRLYQAHGNAIFTGQQANTGLSHDEFGAVADLRREIQKM